jgi:hypothetical protein
VGVFWLPWQHALITAQLKQERANEFSSAAILKLQEFESRKLHTLVGDGRYSTHSWSMQINQTMPPDIMLNVGDAIHNFRSALDHCAYAFWRMDNSILKTSKLKEQEVYFPITGKRRDFIKKINELGLYNDALSAFVDLEGFKGGRGDALYCLSKLDNVDKHRLIPSANIKIEICDIYIRSSEYSAFTFEEKLKPIVISMSSSDIKTSLISREGREVFGHYLFDGMDARLNRYIDDSIAKAKVRVELAEHRPQLYHHCDSTVQGSLLVFSSAVGSVINSLQEVLTRRMPKGFGGNK